MGIKKELLKTLADRITTRGDTLVADLPPEPLRQIELACCCDNCIAPDIYPQLIKTPPPDLTEQHISQYFGGVAAVETVQTPEAIYEARVILTHVLRLMGQMIVLPLDQAREMSLRMSSYADCDYLLPYLLDTGVLDTLPPATTARIRAYLLDMTHYAVAGGTYFIQDVLTYLAVFTDALPEVIRYYRTGPPRHHLRFWSTIAQVNSIHDPNRPQRGTDIHLFYRGMQPEGRQRLIDALAAPEVETLILRYAMGARDQQWMQYLSNLLDWRDAALLAAPHSAYRTERPR
ncbi:hypothetical protein [Gymnodinialimonas ulvae]|uniref:hypothetical protein n=1 Tax=Gymnodinialimonas ulvae TaxID=3126504 RepID=UPI0030A44BDE